MKAFREGHSLIINQGSTGSSKTWSILQTLILIARESPIELIISVCSYALPHLKIGALREFEKILILFGYNPQEIGNRSEHFYKINKSTIEFFGIENNLAKVHGPRRDILFINEVNKKITYEIFDQLNTRTRICTFVDYNPTTRFWIHDDVMSNFEHAYIHSTWRDNINNLSKIEIQKIISKYGKEQFKNWVKVYGEGEIGILEGQIFTNWILGEFDKSLPYGYGLDFGFHPDPDAMIKVALDEKRKKLYLKEEMYETGQSTGELKKAVFRVITKSNDLIIADCADPRLITDLKRKDGRSKFMTLNIHPVKKDGTVSEWLKTLLEYELIIDPESHNLQSELDNYLWSDKKAGIPIDAFNHLIDAFRYYFMYQKQKVNDNVWA